MLKAFYIVPYVRRAGRDTPTRYCAMDDFTGFIVADGGSWSESEILGNRAVVKVAVNSASILTQLDAQYFRLPVDLLLDTIPPGKRNILQKQLQDMGYSLSEIQAVLGDLSGKTLGDVLNFAASRRLAPRYDSASDTIICDGAQLSCKPISVLDAEV